jgi:hypothetical protein
MRELTARKVNECNEALIVEAVDQPGSGGANHRYEIRGFNRMTNASAREKDEGSPGYLLILFQNGPIKECGVNGITNEALLSVVLDRLRGFAKGPYASRDNAIALTHVEDALMRLQNRTRDRIARGVEGKNQP